MSLVLAIKQGNTVYLASETQVSSSSLIWHSTRSDQGKLSVVGPFCVGAVGSLHIHNNVLSSPSLFDVEKEFILTKRWLVETFLPARDALFKKNKLYSQRADGTSYLLYEMMIAHKDRLFSISDIGTVTEHPYSIAIGSPADIALCRLEEPPYPNDVNRSLTEILNYCCELNDSVSAPYIFIDTKDLIERRVR